MFSSGGLRKTLGTGAVTSVRGSPQGCAPPPPSPLTVGCRGPAPRGPWGSPCEAFSPAPGEKLLTGWGAVLRPDLACWPCGPWPQPSRAGAAVPGPRGGAEHVRSGVLCCRLPRGPLPAAWARAPPSPSRATPEARWPHWGAAGRRRRPPPEASLLRARCPRARSPFYLSRRNTERWASGRCALYSSVRSDLRRTLGPGQALCRTSWCLLRGRLWWAGSWVGRASASGDDRGDSEGSRRLSQCSQNFL